LNSVIKKRIPLHHGKRGTAEKAEKVNQKSKGEKEGKKSFKPYRKTNGYIS